MTENMESNYSLSSKASIISLGTFAIALAHLIAAAFLSYSMSKTEYGAFRQVWLVFHTIIPILTLGLPLSINYFIPQMKARDQKALHLQTFLILTLTGFIVSLLFFFCAPLFSLWFNNPGNGSDLLLRNRNLNNDDRAFGMALSQGIFIIFISIFKNNIHLFLSCPTLKNW